MSADGCHYHKFLPSITVTGASANAVPPQWQLPAMGMAILPLI
jgi:hypothetical protein